MDLPIWAHIFIIAFMIISTTTAAIGVKNPGNTDTGGQTDKTSTQENE